MSELDVALGEAREARSYSVSIINPKNLGEVLEQKTYSDIYDLAALISTEHWAPGLFSESRRIIRCFSSINLLVLDIDDGCSLANAGEAFKDFKHIIATSRSHQKEKNGVVCDRFRVVLFLDSEVTNDKDFKATWTTAQNRWPFIDQACKDSSRFFYPSPEIISINETGREYLTSVYVAPPASLASQKNLNRVIEANAPKGDLWKSTLQFLLEGAPPGQRHSELVKAVGNLREQGYPIEETLEKIQEMSERVGDPAFVDAAALKTVERIYSKEEMKYPFVPKEIQKNLNPVIVAAGDLLNETFEYLADKDKVKGDPTGIDGLDKLLGGGFRTGELTVLMAQAKTGKNTLYHHMIYKALQAGIPYGYASRELNPATEVIPNLLSIALQTNAWTADLGEAYQAAAREALSQWKLYFAPGYGHFTVEEMETWFRTLKDLGVNHYLFDHFHYALLTEDHESTAQLIKKLKSLTKELDIHLSLIVQPRSLREGESLSLATLRGGSAIGQALDNLLILERVRGETNISRLTLEVARHKLAKLGDINLLYIPETTEFIEVDRRTVVSDGAPPVPRGIQRGFPRVN